MDKQKKIIDLEIIDGIPESGVMELALVDSPAIEKLWMAFKKEAFVNPTKGEHETEFIPRCIAKLVGEEGYETDQAAAICYSTWRETHAKLELAKISFDFDDTLSTAAGLDLAKAYSDGNELYIISARNEVSQDMLDKADELGIPHSRVFATGSNKAKVEKIIELGISKHIDNNSDVIKDLGVIGEKFGIDKVSIPHYVHEVGKKEKFSIVEDKKIVVGPVAIPDIEIIRQDPDTKEVYWVRFSAEVIQKMAEKFMRENRNNETNLEHDVTVDAKSYIFESWIVEEPTDKANTLYNLDVPVGTWCVKMRVTDPKVWSEVKAGKLNGFSLEGSFVSKEELDQYNKDRELYNKIVKILNSY